MEKVLLEATARQGKAVAKRMKKDGKVAGVVYGKESKSMPVEIKIKDLEKTVKTLSEGSLLITLKLTDKEKSEEKIVVIRELQRDPVTDEIIHADFHQISEKEKATFKVQVHTTGIPEGVKLGGILELVTREVTIRCLPKDLPPKFEMDVSALMIGKSVSLADLKMPAGVELMTDKTKTIAAVVAPHKEEEAKPAEGAVPAEGAEGAAPAEPELIKKERAADEEEGAAPAGDKKAGADKKAPAKEEKKK